MTILKFEGAYAFKLKNINIHIFFQILKIAPFLVFKRKALGLEPLWRAPKSRGETHLKVPQSQVVES